MRKQTYQNYCDLDRDLFQSDSPGDPNTERCIVEGRLNSEGVPQREERLTRGVQLREELSPRRAPSYEERLTREVPSREGILTRGVPPREERLTRSVPQGEESPTAARHQSRDRSTKIRSSSEHSQSTDGNTGVYRPPAFRDGVDRRPASRDRVERRPASRERRTEDSQIDQYQDSSVYGRISSIVRGIRDRDKTAGVEASNKDYVCWDRLTIAKNKSEKVPSSMDPTHGSRPNSDQTNNNRSKPNEDQLAPGQHRTEELLNIYYLHSCRQPQNEQLSTFVKRCKVYVNKCGFDNEQKRQRLLEQLILGTKHKEVRKMIIEEAMSWTDAVNAAQLYEVEHPTETSVESSMPQESKMPQESRMPQESGMPRESRMPQESGMPRESRMPQESKKPQQTRGPREPCRSREPQFNEVEMIQCERCGTEHKKWPRETCPSYGKFCSKCGKLNHNEVACKWIDYRQLCSYCGTVHLPGRQKHCPAFGQECGHCGKMGHSANMCMRKHQVVVQRPPQRVQPALGQRFPNEQHYQPRLNQYQGGYVSGIGGYRDGATRGNIVLSDSSASDENL